MSNVATAKQNIYDRLANAPVFHPSSADLFTDWTLQGGDVVRINSGSDSYDVPVYGLRIKWNGVSKVSIQSSGNETRDSVDVMAQRQASNPKNRYYGGIRSKNRSDGLYSFISDTTSAIRIEVGNTKSEIRAFIETTPEMIHAEVGSAVSGFAQSVIEQTSTYIRMEVSNAASAISQSVIEQTTEYVRTEVASVASGVAYSVVIQTMTNIEQKIARKSRVYMQLTDPNDGINQLLDGDIWIKADVNKTWNDNGTYTWNSQASRKWREKYGDLYYVWKNGRWIPSVDTSRDVENQVLIEHTDKLYAINAKAKNLEGEEFRSRLEVTSREITSSVSAAKSQLYSTIQQTATNIRAEVANVQAGLQSSIEQTASSITTSVSAAKSSLYSTILQTATGIYTNVTDYVSGNYSTILQTSTSISLAVESAKSTLRSEIKVQSDKISLVVSGTGANAKIKPAAIVASINDGASNIKLSADHIDIDGLVSALRVLNIQVQTLMASGDIETEDGAVVAPSIQGGEAIIDDYISVNGYDLNVSDISISGNTMTITYVDGTTANFSKATTLTGQWSSGVYTVTASPQGNTDLTSLTNTGHWGVAANGEDVNKYYYKTYATRNGQATSYDTGNATIIDGKVRYDAGMSDYYNSSYWKKPQDNNGVCKIPNETNTGDETWFTMSSMGITRRPVYKNSSGNYEYYGKLYYYDNSVSPGVYRAASDSDGYWYRSGTNKTGSTTVYY